MLLSISEYFHHNMYICYLYMHGDMMDWHRVQYLSVENVIQERSAGGNKIRLILEPSIGEI